MKLLLDEHVQIALATALRQQGLDVLTIAEIARRSLPDEAQLEWAAQQAGHNQRKRPGLGPSPLAACGFYRLLLQKSSL